MGMNRYPLAAGAAALLLLLGACGSSESAAPGPGGIAISGSAYSGSMTVKPGQQVTVTNEDPADHTLTSRTAGLFNTGTIPAGGGTATFTAPTAPGSYPFFCRIHLAMNGTLVVQG
jgi:plastocyanin